eukprot:4234064-Lingulodinium_polyedra.AAC.1
MKRFRLDKLLKEVYPQAGEIWKYTAFPAGTLPKVLVKKNPQQSHSFYSKANEKAIYKFINAAKDCTMCSLLWIVKLSSSGTPPRLEPAGLALVGNKHGICRQGRALLEQCVDLRREVLGTWKPCVSAGLP